MILPILAAASLCNADITTINQKGGVTAGCVGAVHEVEPPERFEVGGPFRFVTRTTAWPITVCDDNPNAPVTVCVTPKGGRREVRIQLPAPPCGTPEAGDGETCTAWSTNDAPRDVHRAKGPPQ